MANHDPSLTPASLAFPELHFFFSSADPTVARLTPAPSCFPATIAANKEGVKFSVSGDMGTGNVTVRQNASCEKEQQTLIELQEPVSLTFALRYLNFFTKATPMSEQVTLSLSKEVPLAVEYQVGEMGHLRYYLAPKVDEDE